MSARGLNELKPDWGLVLLTGSLLGIGLIMLTSASMSVAESSTGKPFFYLTQQLLAVGVGLTAAAFVLKVPTESWERAAPLLLILAMLLLAVVLIPGIGREVNGSRRWLNLGVNIQVSEPARLLVLIYIASYAVRHRDDFAADFKGFVRRSSLYI